MIGDLYTSLFELKHDTPALWNGNWGGKMIPVPNSQPKAIFSFVRQKGKSKVFTVLNFSDQPQTVSFNENAQVGVYREWFSKAKTTIDPKTALTIEPFGYCVFVK